MKLLLCEDCWDVFKLTRGEMRKCKCGKVKGRYLDNVTAEVSPNAVSIAIGNGSLEQAIEDAYRNLRHSNGEAERKSYYEPGKGKIEYAWVRPNSGPGNPHTRLIEKEADNG